MVTFGGPKRPVVKIAELEQFLKKDLSGFLKERQDSLEMVKRFKRAEADVTNMINTEIQIAQELKLVWGDLNNAINAVKGRNFGAAYPPIQDAFNKLNLITVNEVLLRGEIAKLRSIFAEDERFNRQVASIESQVEVVTSRMRQLTNALREQILAAQTGYVRT